VQEEAGRFVGTIFAIGSDHIDVELMQSQRKLEADITSKKLLRGAQQLQDFAYSYPARNRIMGGSAHNDTVNWIKKELESTSYYDVTLQPFSNYAMLEGKINSFTIGGKAINSTLYEYSNSTHGLLTAPLAVVANFGCEASDYPSSVAGNIALISRGSCDFGLKSALAGSAGAAAAIIYNNVPGTVNGGLGTPGRPEGAYVATVSLTQAEGQAYVSQIQGGANVTASLLPANAVTRTTSSPLAHIPTPSALVPE
jgi:hypothetical protein